MHGNPGGGAVDGAQVLWCEIDGGGPEIFLEAMQLGGAGDRDVGGVLGENPREGDLGGRGAEGPARDSG
jgi:hypothetical protein